MIVYSIGELSLIGVYDRGVPNQERIVIQANETVNLGQYGLMIGVRSVGNSAFPVRDNLLWFGDGIVKQGDWIFVYTGPGKAKVSPIPNTDINLYSVHWDRGTTILANQELVPILFRVDAIQVPIPIAALLEPQG